MGWNSISAQTVQRNRRTGEIDRIVIVIMRPIQPRRVTLRMFVQVSGVAMMGTGSTLAFAVRVPVRVPVQRQVNVRSRGMVVWLSYAAARMRMGQRLHQQEREDQQ